ncbi:response regulator receiver protein [Methanosalsum zhilinae DSM 4017]|uniref:Response regulator receiver protein n=1 Tax=Methanosalsum zhilinae (strain DSM 4017 / NBRC 107636 / OCM 62 / WeN5) TaxID=679901 RepID=F7XQH2_METZD|nr:response regulator [Methanosalsum zhilinae]AEH60473.1 response regulator receiver protein [Methanosalsum zhilinae DSM 4017]
MDKTKILIVEDENIIALNIKKKLRNIGYIVPGIASTGKEAIEKAEITFPDLVLMDIRLKGEMDGVEAASQIRDKFDIPVIYLTAYSDEEILERAKKTEPYGYILKPFKESELRTSIEVALHKHKMEKGKIQ